MWRGREWDLLLTLIDHLPRNSAYMEALSLDEEFAREILNQQDREKGEAPRNNNAMRISEWSPEVELLTAIFDRLAEVMTAVIAAAGGKPPKPKPLPRPRTAMDRIKEQRRYEKHKKTVARVLIQQDDGTSGPPTSAPPHPTGVPQPSPFERGSDEDPYRMRSRRSVPNGGPVTGEPLPRR